MGLVLPGTRCAHYLYAMQQATVSMGSRHPNITPNSSILPTLGAKGRAARWRPSFVKASVPSWIAPMSSNSLRM